MTHKDTIPLNEYLQNKNKINEYLQVEPVQESPLTTWH
jgi:hypothetical protein